MGVDLSECSNQARLCSRVGDENTHVHTASALNECNCCTFHEDVTYKAQPDVTCVRIPYVYVHIKDGSFACLEFVVG